jgi:hypothetical protein
MPVIILRRTPFVEPHRYAFASGFTRGLMISRRCSYRSDAVPLPGPIIDADDDD